MLFFPVLPSQSATQANSSSLVWHFDFCRVFSCYASVEGFTFFVTFFRNRTAPEHLARVQWLDFEKDEVLPLFTKCMKVNSIHCSI